jgi:tetratricopeptide (TPR) repeat protein
MAPLRNINSKKEQFDLRIVTTISSDEGGGGSSSWSYTAANKLASLDKELISPSCSVSTSSTASIRSFFSDTDTSPKKKYNPEPGFRSTSSNSGCSQKSITPIQEDEEDTVTSSSDTHNNLLTDPWNQFLVHKDKAAPRRLSKIRWAFDTANNAPNNTTTNEKGNGLKFSTVKLRRTASSLLRQTTSSKSKKVTASSTPTTTSDSANAPLPGVDTPPAAPPLPQRPTTTAPLVLKEPRYSPRNGSSSSNNSRKQDSNEDGANRATATFLNSVDNTLKAASASTKSGKSKSATSRAVHRRIRSKTVVAALHDSIDESMQKGLDLFHKEQYTRCMAHYMDAIQLLYKTGELSPAHPTSITCLQQLRKAHHTYLCVLNSDKIIQMGQEQERLGRYFRAYKFYVTALNVRQDALGKQHASLSTILNILGALQTKRGHLREASALIRQVLQLQQFHANAGESHKANPTTSAGANAAPHAMTMNPSMLVQQAVTTRNMGIVQEAHKHFDVALDMYQISLRLHRLSRGLEEECGDSDSDSKCLNALLKSNLFLQGEGDPQDIGIRKSMSSLLDTDDGEDEDEKGTAEEEGIECDGGIPSYSPPSQSPPPQEPSQGQYQRAIQDEGMEAIYEMSHHSSSPYHIDLEHTFKFNVNETGTPISTGDGDGGDKDAHIKADIELAITLHMAGRLLAKQLHNPQAALKAYNNALEWMTHALGADHPNTAAILGNIANVHRLEGNYEEAYKLYLQVLEIETQTFGKWHTEVGVTFHNLGCIEYDRGNVKEAIKLFQKSMKIHKDVAGIDSRMVAITSTSIANVCETVGDYQQAFMAYEVALGVTKMTSGNASLDTASLYMKMGHLLQNHLHHLPTHLAEAEEMYELALDIYQSSHHDFTDHHELVKKANRALADIHASLCLGSISSNTSTTISIRSTISTSSASLVSDADSSQHHRHHSSPAAFLRVPLGCIPGTGSIDPSLSCSRPPQ